MQIVARRKRPGDLYWEWEEAVVSIEGRRCADWISDGEDLHKLLMHEWVVTLSF